MNIAVLIGISAYKKNEQLPACSSDLVHMHKLLSATRKYTEIHTISSNTDSGPLKDDLRGFFARYQNSEPIEEALVYFSGHGFYRDDVLLCCSDFDIKRPATTSISNSELDDLLRSVAPIVAVKIIDACQSGSPYIKDTVLGFEKALRESNLKSFICMASSRTDQSSYATAECSLFTDHLIDAALVKPYNPFVADQNRCPSVFDIGFTASKKEATGQRGQPAKVLAQEYSGRRDRRR